MSEISGRIGAGSAALGITVLGSGTAAGIGGFLMASGKARNLGFGSIGLLGMATGLLAGVGAGMGVGALHGRGRCATSLGGASGGLVGGAIGGAIVADKMHSGTKGALMLTIGLGVAGAIGGALGGWTLS